MRILIRMPIPSVCGWHLPNLPTYIFPGAMVLCHHSSLLGKHAELGDTFCREHAYKMNKKTCGWKYCNGKKSFKIPTNETKEEKDRNCCLSTVLNLTIKYNKVIEYSDKISECQAKFHFYFFH